MKSHVFSNNRSRLDGLRKGNHKFSSLQHMNSTVSVNLNILTVPKFVKNDYARLKKSKKMQQCADIYLLLN